MTGSDLLLDDTPFALALRIADVDLWVRTNDDGICERLASYFRNFVTVPHDHPAVEVRLIQGVARPPGPFTSVPREGGRKTKEAVREGVDGRLILKLETGVVMGIAASSAFAVGDLRTHLNQGINLVNACYARVVTRRGHVLLHASAVSQDGRAAMLAGPPGAGKSTASLHLVEEGFKFLSNDRVLVREDAGTVEALGYPKQPRVNPGTLLHHRRLHSLLDAADREALGRLPAEELRMLERKTDVDLDAVYGKGTVELTGTARALLLLKWRIGGGRCAARDLTPAEAMGELPLFQKSLGVFDLDRPARAPGSADSAQYAAVLDRLRLVVVTGGMDLPALTRVVAELLRR